MSRDCFKAKTLIHEYKDPWGRMLFRNPLPDLMVGFLHALLGCQGSMAWLSRSPVCIGHYQPRV